MSKIPNNPLLPILTAAVNRQIAAGAPIITAVTGPFHKVMFSRTGHGCTAGLVVDAAGVDVSDMAAVSRLFPYSAARLMRTYHVSPAYSTWDEAFAHVFNVTIEGLPVRASKGDR